MQSLSGLPDEASVWIYAADRPLGSEDLTALEASLNTLKESWSSHGRAVQGAWSIEFDRIVVISGYVKQGDLSGCGIDKSLHALQKVASINDFSWVDSLCIVYRDTEGELHTCSRSEFRELAEHGIVTTESPVISLSHSSLGSLRQDGLEQPAGTSWHGRVFSLQEGSPRPRSVADPS